MRHLETHLHHDEEHFTGNATVQDIVIGMADGLTVPFALAAGVSGAASGANIVIAAGLAEIAAGSIAMGLGGYLAGRSAVEHYDSEAAREEREIVEKPEVERAEVAAIFAEYGLNEAEYTPILDALERQPEKYRDFMMRFELGLEKPEPTRALRSGITIALAYVAGGMIPLAPYLITHDIRRALLPSVVVTLLALFVFGWIKGRYTGVTPWKSAIQTLLVGGLAAAAAYGLARWLG
jgi:VIT1/CCC1 family predicted Fe2+/Mn2+ transporter